MSDRRLLLVRHGITDWNREGRFQGHLDPPLSEEGRREAALLADRLARNDALRPRRIIASALARAHQTAAVIGDAAQRRVESDTRLIEIGQGDWEGHTHAELAVSDAQRYAAWRSAVGSRRPPGGETIGNATARVASLLADVRRDDEWPVCLVSHGGTLRILARVLLRLRAARSWALDVDNASLSVALKIPGSWQVERWNDTLHLLGRTPTHVDEAEGRPLAL